MTRSRRWWTGLLALAALAAVVVLVPVLLIRPVAPQTPATLAIAFALRRWSPLITLVAAGGAVFLGWRLWRTPGRPRSRVAVLGVTLVALGSAWLARQNHFEWMFAPLPDPRFVRAAEAGFVAPDDMVLAVAIGGDAAAYPVRQLAYHHLVEDTVGKVPIVATY